MKAVVTLALAAVLSAGAYCIYFACATAPAQAMLSAPQGELEWLRREYDLDDAQFARIKALREAYQPQCAKMCDKIAKADKRLDEAIRNNATVTAEVEAAVKTRAEVEDECRRATLAHVYAVAAEMNPSSAREYIAMMAPRLLRPQRGYAIATESSGR